jgi:phosphoglycolate phosphatase
MKNISLIIFDCDGVLVDTEHIESLVFAEMLTELGLRTNYERCALMFKGMRMAKCIELIERQLGHRVLPSFESEFRRRSTKRFSTDLRPVTGIEQVLDRVRYPNCVVSNSPREKIVATLRLTGLLDRFRGRIMSAYDVESWKPDPRLYLYAAGQMQVRPENCVVIEDSLPGVQAAVAAGMQVFGYARQPYSDLLQEEGATIFDEMRLLPELLVTTD